MSDVKKDEYMKTFFRYDDVLYLSDRVIFYKDRVVVPVSLQFCVLDNLHSTHQGVALMQSHAQQIVF